MIRFLKNAVIAGLKERARLMGVSFMVVGLPYDGHYLVPGLLAAGFQHKPNENSTRDFMEATAVINLSQEPEQMFAAMRRRHTSECP